MNNTDLFGLIFKLSIIITAVIFAAAIFFVRRNNRIAKKKTKHKSTNTNLGEDYNDAKKIVKLVPIIISFLATPAILLIVFMAGVLIFDSVEVGFIGVMLVGIIILGLFSKKITSLLQDTKNRKNK
jgi:membrane protein implicated in regulation of membrane protease activity